MTCVHLGCMTKSLALLAFGAAVGMAQAAEPTYPARPIRFVVGFAPGGGADAMARIFAPKLTDSMGQNWVVDNRTGAGGNLAAEIVARAIPDGHTVLLGLDTQLTASQSLYKLPFSIEKDLQPVTLLSTADSLVVVHPSVQANTLKEFVALAQQKPGSLNYGSGGVGSSNHLTAELLKKRIGIDMKHVPYKGAGPAIAGMLAGETQVLVASAASTVAFVNAGRLRALATTGAKRSKVAPDVPTVAESGYPGFEAFQWYAILVPGGTPNAIVARIRNDALQAMKHPEVQNAMARLALEPASTTPAELAARISAESRVWAGIIKDIGITAQ
jgi:tripartite-type tricarboxylate transporter receptor subunit TctC